MAKKEKCPRCGGVDIAIAQDKSNKHYCQTKGCMHVFVPGLDGLKRTDVIIKKLQEENEALRDEVFKLRQAAKPKTKSKEEDEIFDL